MAVVPFDPGMMALRPGVIPGMSGRARGMRKFIKQPRPSIPTLAPLLTLENGNPFKAKKADHPDPGTMGMAMPHPAMAMGMGMGIPMGMPMAHTAMAMMGIGVGMPTRRRHPFTSCTSGGNNDLAALFALYGGHRHRGRRCYDDLDLELERDPYFFFNEDWWDSDSDDDECDDPILLYSRERRRMKRGRGRYGRRGIGVPCSSRSRTPC